MPCKAFRPQLRKFLMTGTEKIDWSTVASKICDKYEGTEIGDSYMIRCPCPGHDDTNPSCKVFVDQSVNKLMVRCYVCDELEPHSAWKALVAAGDIPRLDNTASFMRIWDQADSGHVFFESYLESRGLYDISMPETIRVHDTLWHRELRDEFVCIVSSVQNANDDICGLHRIYLNTEQDGKLDVSSNKMLLGPCRGGHISLRNGEDVLHVSEGLETGFGVLSNLPKECAGHAVWAACTASMLANVSLPKDKFSAVHIWADHDFSGTGEKTARKLGLRLLEAGISCFLHIPAGSLSKTTKSIDWLDQCEQVETVFENANPFAATRWEADGAILPDGYSLSVENGVIREYYDQKGNPKNKQLSAYPVWISARCPNIEDSGSWVEVTYWSASHRRYESANVPRSAFSSKKSFQESLLNCSGISVDLNAQGELCDFLRRCSDLTDNERYLAFRSGWNEFQDTQHFIPYSNDVSLHANSAGEKVLSTAFNTKGTLSGWINEVLKPLSTCYGASVAFAMGAASPIIELVDAPAYSVCLTATADGGKSVATNCVLSMWGAFNKMTLDAGSTRVGVMAALNFFHDLPVAVDETQLAHVADILKLIYGVGNSSVRVAAQKTGGLRVPSKARNILFIPGEAKIMDNLSFDGGNIRALEVAVPPLAEISDPDARKNLHHGTLQHFGHVGPLYVKELQRMHADGSLRELYEDCHESFDINFTFQNRLRPRYAAMLTGLRVLRNITDDHAMDAVERSLLRHWRETAQEKPKKMVSYRALQSVLEHVVSNPGAYSRAECYSNFKIIGEYQSDGSLALIRSELVTLFGEKFEVGNVLAEWKNRGWLRFRACEKGAATYLTPATIGTCKNLKSVVIRHDVIEQYHNGSLAEGSISTLGAI